MGWIFHNMSMRIVASLFHAFHHCFRSMEALHVALNSHFLGEDHDCGVYGWAGIILRLLGALMTSYVF